MPKWFFATRRPFVVSCSVETLCDCRNQKGVEKKKVRSNADGHFEERQASPNVFPTFFMDFLVVFTTSRFSFFFLFFLFFSTRLFETERFDTEKGGRKRTRRKALFGASERKKERWCVCVCVCADNWKRSSHGRLFFFLSNAQTRWPATGERRGKEKRESTPSQTCLGQEGAGSA